MRPLLSKIALFAHIIRSCVDGLALSWLTPQLTILSTLHSTKSHVECRASDNRNEHDEPSSYYQYLLSQFQGDFDNYEQVVQDRRHGLTPGEGGGHEHIHCMIVPCPHYGSKKYQQHQSQWLLAAFYFNANPRQIFRFRLYQLLPPPSDELPVRMKLNSLSPRLEQQLREYSDQPCMWWREVWNAWCRDNMTTKRDNNAPIYECEWHEMQTVGLPSMVLPLDGCDVLWEPNWDPSKHPYLYMSEYDDFSDSTTEDFSGRPKLPTGKSCHAVMEAGSAGAIVNSISLIPGKRILIKDELSLWNNEFWINDRGYDPDNIVTDTIQRNEDGNAVTMSFVYGNRRGVPYKLRRVSNFYCKEREHESPANTDTWAIFKLERIITNTDLIWTLGESYRTPDMLLHKMSCINNQYNK